MPRVAIAGVSEELVCELHYLNASSRGGTDVSVLPIERAELVIANPPEELDAIVACSDLQGMRPGPGGEAHLLGIGVAERLEELAADGLIPSTARIGVVLAGDLFSVAAANKRGGFGDVGAVWEAFASRFAWVAGVAGNHDDVAGVRALRADNVHLLDGESAEIDGLRIGGVGGIIGNPAKKMRRTSEDFLALVDRVLEQHVDVLVLHEGPNGDGDQHGNVDVRLAVEVAGLGLTICGHSHWDRALAAHATGQILNVDARVVVMTVRR